MTRILLVLVLAACPSKGPKDPAYTPAGPKPCEKMADHVVGDDAERSVTNKPIDAHRGTSGQDHAHPDRHLHEGQVDAGRADVLARARVVQGRREVLAADDDPAARELR
jgi:hypothetical protein